VAEETMLKSPGHWIKHYHGSEEELKMKRRYSYSDRIRYYLTEPELDGSIKQLIKNIDNNKDLLPLSIVSQYMPSTYWKIREGKLKIDDQQWLIERVKDTLSPYARATKQEK